MYVDSHCHLDRLDLKPYNGDLSSALNAAREQGVSRMLCVGISMANAAAVMRIARENPGVSASVGIHPMDVAKGEADWQQLAEWASRPEVVAIGETGLDYYYSEDSAEAQRDSFDQHLALATRVGKPVIVHTRDAREDTLAIIRSHAHQLPGGVLHCFTESWEMAKQALDMGFYISFSGIVTFANAKELREVARQVPLDRLLIETDSPYLAPVPYRGKKNEPKYVPEVAAALAKLHETSVEDIASITSTNYDKLFF